MLGQRGWEAAGRAVWAGNAAAMPAGTRHAEMPGSGAVPRLLPQGLRTAMGELLPCAFPAPRLLLPQHNVHSSGTPALLICTVARGHMAPTGPSLVWAHQGAPSVPATLASPSITSCAPPRPPPGIPWLPQGEGAPLPPGQPGGTLLHIVGAVRSCSASEALERCWEKPFPQQHPCSWCPVPVAETEIAKGKAATGKWEQMRGGHSPGSCRRVGEGGCREAGSP